jgi:tRNA modification GTPase
MRRYVSLIQPSRASRRARGIVPVRINKFSQQSRRLISNSSNVTIKFTNVLIPPSARTDPTIRHGYSNDTEDTIFALSTAPGRAAIAIIRISGPACLAIYASLCPGKPVPKPRNATIRTLYAPNSASDVLDSSAMILYFPSPNSATGEDVLELHVHAGPAIVQAVLRAIPRCHSAFSPDSSSSKIRYAEPGEFTRRAFMNDRLDLTQAEALGDMLTASTEQQRRRALRGASGALAARYESWRGMLLAARGEMEALIDFAEDQQLSTTPAELLRNVTAQVVALRERVGVHVANAARGEMVREGISVALVGMPNAGKSSLLNLIVGREAAIVSDERGTTRDVLEVVVDLNGWPVRLGDMAGLRGGGGDSKDGESQQIGKVEWEGIRRAKERALESDVVVVLLSYDQTQEGLVEVTIDPEILDTMQKCLDNGARIIIAVNKSDLSSSTLQTSVEDTARLRNCLIRTERRLAGVPIVTLSCKQAASTNPTEHIKSGLSSLINDLTTTFEEMTSAIQLEPTSPGSSTARLADMSEWEESLGGSERQRLLLEECSSHLDSYLALTQAGLNSALESPNEELDDGAVDIVLVAESLRAAADALARITGRGEAGDVEEVLGVVFEKYVSSRLVL